jgi:hypothetical protein
MGAGQQGNQGAGQPATTGQGSTGAQQPGPNQDVGQNNTTGQSAPQAPQNSNPNAGAPQSGGQAK